MDGDGYGHVSGDKHKNKKRIAIITVSSLILVAMVVAVAVGINNTDESEDGETGDMHSGGNVKASAKAVKAICKPAEYKKTCEEKFGKVAVETSDPREIIKASFNLTIHYINDAAKRSQTLRELEKDKSSREALAICRDLMDLAVDDFLRAFDEAEKFDINNIDAFTHELKVWLGGALAYQETCLEAFENTTGKAGADMQKALKTSNELTRNALDIVDEIVNVITSLGIPLETLTSLTKTKSTESHRRLLATSDAYPSWVTPDKRKLLSATPGNIKPNLVVAKDGSGKFKTINDALKEVPQKNDHPFIIYVKEGVYNEIVLVPMTNVMFIGDGKTKTKITGSRSFHSGFKTINTATFSAIGLGFIAKDIGFENTAGHEGHQAVALRVHSDSSIMYNCQMDGYQDTLYAHSHRQFYRDCTISGTIDFIFGDAAAVFQNCLLLVRKPGPNQSNHITAQGRYNDRETSAIVLQGCRIQASPELEPVKHQVKTFLGRPWKNFSRTVIMHTHMDDFIQPEGWAIWDNTNHHETCYYAEYHNKGSGSQRNKRVKWPGVKTIDGDTAKTFTPNKFFMGDEWIKKASIPYTPDMWK